MITLANNAKRKYVKINVLDMVIVWNTDYAHVEEDGKAKIVAKPFAQRKINSLIVPDMVHVSNTYIQLQEMDQNH